MVGDGSENSILTHSPPVLRIHKRHSARSFQLVLFADDAALYYRARYKISILLHLQRAIDELAVANKCLRLGYSPRAWKVAAIKVIPKPGKDYYSRPKSYRPIGLFSVIGKTVERMLVCRIKWHIMPKLQARQFGFMPQRGREDSLYDLMTHIYNELSLKKIILMVSLEIEGAFDNVWWPAIRNQLLAHKCPVNLYSMVMGYLRDREVVVRYAGGESRKMTW
ncbi:RNA-directed DNA polymerase from mobile element jockey [Eumeta japonica]|uniref:RNA-directed DNA polymerase from mobile element jockey n=1 Tax=Eumeta variegata TaxID=151549 RepID=A0A4C1Z101_EUMVA|nr:RNA-directed DNA polymerase from mobile element jockey [Eumeta japonica]